MSAPETAPQISPVREIPAPKGDAMLLAVSASRPRSGAYAEKTAMEQLAPRLKAATASPERLPIMEVLSAVRKNGIIGGWNRHFRFQVSIALVPGSMNSTSSAVKTRITKSGLSTFWKYCSIIGVQYFFFVARSSWTFPFALMVT